jgi:SAM-dependent methyltransferase
VTAFDVIEHHPDPRSLLVEMRRIVKPGGLVVIGTHDVGNFFARIYGRHWRHMSAIGHLTYFTSSTLTKMMETSGFRVVHRGGAHTIDQTALAEWRNRIKQFFRLIALRAAILGIYQPLAAHIPILTRWKYQRAGFYLDHPKLLMRAGNQVIMNDNMVLLALAT